MIERGTNFGGTDKTRRVSSASLRVHGVDRGAFTLVEVLVSIAVLAVLIAIMLPTLGGVRESARRVACASNLRQMGLATYLYSNRHDGELPSVATATAVFSLVAARDREGRTPPPPMTAFAAEPLSSTVLRYGPSAPLGVVNSNGWDGWGLLFADDLLTTPEIVYCPSHRDGVTSGEFRDGFKTDRRRVVGNYALRGANPGEVMRFSALEPTTAIGSDSLGDLGWLNHEGGLNVMQASLAVRWQERDLVATFPSTPGDHDEQDPTELDPVEDSDSLQDRFETEQQIWNTLDGRQNGPSSDSEED